MTQNSSTFGAVMFRMIDGKPQFLGILQNAEKATADAEILAKHGQEWEFAVVPFIGWGQAAPGVFSQNGKPTLKVVS